MKLFLSQAELNCEELEGWKRDVSKELQPGWGLVPHTGHSLRDVGREISYAYSERKLINVFNLWGYHSRAKASHFKRAQYSE